MGIFSDFLESTSIHGLRYLAIKNAITRSIWFICVATSFSVAIFFISASFKGWDENPSVVSSVGPALVEVRTV